MKLAWFIVKVPVLSLQIVVADPIVSHADSLRTLHLSHIEVCKHMIDKSTISFYNKIRWSMTME